jgi:CRP-like cAMP-binding protein
LERAENAQAGEIIYRMNDPTSYVYFPINVVYSHVVALDDGRRIEAATIGNEGMLGLHVAFGVDFSPGVAVCQVPGTALRAPVHDFLAAARPGGYLDHVLRRYAAYRLQCMHQSVACNTTHSVEERMSRWLLMVHDRVGRDEFPLTHESLAQAMGVRRQTVTLVARTLRAAGFIGYRRGVVRILNRRGLERVSCECYEAGRDTYESLVRSAGKEDLDMGRRLLTRGA